MGTASTMNALAEALGMSLPGSAAIPAPYRERGQMAYETGKRIVDMVWEDLKPSDIMTREAFENVIVANSAIGGSTNAPIHINAIAKHIGVQLDCDDWEKIGYDMPLLVNMQPAGFYLGEEYFRAGGLPAVIAELIEAGKIHEGALTANGSTIGENCRGKFTWDREVIRAYEQAAEGEGRLPQPQGHPVRLGDHEDERDLARSSRSAISTTRRTRTPSRARSWSSTGPRTTTTASTIRRSGIDEHTILIMRGAGPIGYPGAAEVVNMQPPGALIQRGVHSLPCIGDGRQSGTSGTPSILNASPEAAAGGGLALLQTGDRVRIDLNKRTADILLLEGGARRAARQDLEARGGYRLSGEPDALAGDPARAWSTSCREGMVLKPAVKYQKVAQTFVPRDNH